MPASSDARKRLTRRSQNPNADAIPAKIAESIRQSLIQTQLANIAQEIQLHAATTADATRQIASTVATLDDLRSRPGAGAQQAVTVMLADLANAASHVRSLTKDLTRSVILSPCFALLLLLSDS